MIKTLTACTNEIDDVDLAVSEILDQLDLKNNQCKNSVGILTCYSEFIDTGVVKALCEKLPFDVAGTTTIGNAGSSVFGQMMLCVSVLTSDDVSFSTVVSDSIVNEQMEPLSRAYAEAASAADKKPAMLITFAPLVRHVAGDHIVSVLNSISGNVPNFGTVALDHNIDYHDAQTIYNGEAFKDRLVLILVFGDINPRFLLLPFPKRKSRNSGQ
ncbi:hypothetical protein K7I13_00275 [Brucepastera parasyntrophica]|uniref:FIST N-terminal domain-containing protein n=1 Tax=Brucepastera parasyntrophica TaxID=2880008 RepID=UPI00210C607A|nr:FIST N-terminal domain-containing protein [Brucepastera parasyntrophica]ULQ59834.1 hypothetical protein K7I13_00275 [Brucepastera parasyntrophica]